MLLKRKWIFKAIWQSAWRKAHSEEVMKRRKKPSRVDYSSGHREMQIPDLLKAAVACGVPRQNFAHPPVCD
jgi:hypothetical protein